MTKIPLLLFASSLSALALDVSSLGSNNTNLGHNVRVGDLTIAAPSGADLFLGETAANSPSLGIAGGLLDSTVSEEETLHFTFHAPARLDSLTLAGFGGGDGTVIVAGFPDDPGATLSNGTTAWSNGMLLLTATSFADLASVSFATPQTLTRLVISVPDANNGADGLGLHQLNYTAQPRKLYRELFPNGIREDRDLSTAGWDDSAASDEGGGGPNIIIDPTVNTVNASDLGSTAGTNLGTSASFGGLAFTSANGDLYIGIESTFESIGVTGGFKDTTLNGTESITLTPADGMVLRTMSFTGAGANDSPAVLTGFLSDPGATLSNGTTSYDGGTLTLTFTSFAQEAVLTLANDAAAATISIVDNATNAGAGGVGIKSLTYQNATGLTTPTADTATIAGVLGDDYAYLTDLTSDAALKAIVTTESDTVDFDPADFSLLEIRWQQAGAAKGANITVRPMIQVGTQWYASATGFATGGDDEAFSTKSLTVDVSTPGWLPATLGTNSVTLGAATTPATGEITNLGLLADFTTDNASEDQTIRFDDVELCGIPLNGVSIPWTFVSMPDFTNADIGDVSGALTGVPEASGWDGGQNGTTAELEDSFGGLLDAMASEAADLALIAGDSLEGEWFKDAAGRQIVGPVGNDANRELAWVEGSFYFYGHLVNEWFLSRGMEPIVAIGDHEYGDNDWGTNANNTKLIPLMRSEFGRWFGRFPRGQWDTYVTSPPAEAGRPDRTAPDFKQANAPFLWPDRPTGTDYEETAYAVRHRDTLLISIDVFYHKAVNDFLYPYGSTVTATLGPTSDTQYDATPDLGQLAWVQNLLAEAKADPTIKHIIVQGHTPILQPVLTTSSSGMTYRDGEESGLWQSFIANGVDLYFCGETHDIAASRHQGVQQINHGSPPGSRVLNYLVGRVHSDRIELTLKTGRQYRDSTIPYWQPEDGNGKNGFAEIREPFTAVDQIIIDKSGPEDVITDGTGLLSNIEHDDLLIHYPFDEAPGTRQMSNQGTLPDLNADGSRKWRGDLDASWRAATDFSAGKIGDGLTFDGINGDPDQILSGGPPTPLGKPRTVAFWIKTTHNGFLSIAGYGDQTKAMSNFNIQKDATNQLRLAIGGSESTLAAGSPVLNDGQWHHCAVVVPAWNSRLNEVRFYVDGVFYPSSTASTQTVITRTTSQTGPKFRIGRATHSTSAPLVGSLDDFAIWGRALSDAEVKLLCEFGSSAFAYDAGEVDLLLKAFREGTGVTIGSQTWFYLGQDLRGAPGTVYDTGSSDTIAPVTPGAGFSTTPDLGAIGLGMKSITLDEGTGMVTLTWDSLTGATYTIRSSTTLSGSPDTWTVEESAVASQGTETTTSISHTVGTHSFFVVEETP